jgi:hypothetical protein
MRPATIVYLVLCALLLPGAACSGSTESRVRDAAIAEADAEADGDGSPGDSATTEDGARSDEIPAYLGRLSSADEYATLQGQDEVLKFLLRVDGRQPPAPLEDECVFQDTRSFPWHIQFLLSFEGLEHLETEAYLDLVMQRSSRVWWGGGMQPYPTVWHPVTGQQGVISYTVYTDESPEEALTVDEYAQIDGRLKSCAPYAEEMLVLTAEGPAVIARLRQMQQKLAGRGVTVVFPEDLVSR